MIEIKRNITETWEAFCVELQSNILPMYEQHEKKFDFSGIHGRLHICRALIFAEFMIRYYAKNDTILPHYNAIRYATAFHDSGRKGNGTDIWESESAIKCSDYLKVNSNFPEDPSYCEYVGGLILKHGSWDGNKKIVHDADVLEIMRPCCGHGGRNGFNEPALRFLSQRDGFLPIEEINKISLMSIRNQFIDEAWIFIQQTENRKYELRNSTAFMDDLLLLLKENEKLSLLKAYLLV